MPVDHRDRAGGTQPVHKEGSVSNPHANKLFGHIETRATLPDGRTVTSSMSYPEGVGYDVYRKTDEDLVRAYGNDGSKTIGTFLEDTGKLETPMR